MSPPKTNRPKTALRILRRILPRDDARYLIGDFTEIFEESRSERGIIYARFWIWRQVMCGLPGHRPCLCEFHEPGNGAFSRKVQGGGYAQGGGSQENPAHLAVPDRIFPSGICGSCGCHRIGDCVLPIHQDGLHRSGGLFKVRVIFN